MARPSRTESDEGAWLRDPDPKLLRLLNFTASHKA